MIKLTMFNQKGGVGKTTSAIHLAASFAKYNHKRVLIVDADAQHNVTMFTTSIREDPITLSWYDCVFNNVPLSDVIVKENIPAKSGRKKTDTEDDNETMPINVSILPSDERLYNVTFDDHLVLKHLLDQVENDYDICFIDCPTQRTPTAMVGLCAADYLLVPLTPSIYSVEGYSTLDDVIGALNREPYDVPIKLLGIFMNNFKALPSVDNFVNIQVRGSYGDRFFKTSIRSSTVINQAEVFSTPICYFRENHPITQDFRKLGNEILKRLKDEENK